MKARRSHSLKRGLPIFIAFCDRLRLVKRSLLAMSRRSQVVALAGRFRGVGDSIGCPRVIVWEGKDRVQPRTEEARSPLPNGRCAAAWRPTSAVRAPTAIVYGLTLLTRTFSEHQPAFSKAGVSRVVET
jgi:hypothetical protein